ncbi:UNVERIFIED_CONTAM: hypothetical protein NCL1_21517 [Trichonephila clavipes]
MFRVYLGFCSSSVECIAFFRGIGQLHQRKFILILRKILREPHSILLSSKL